MSSKDRRPYESATALTQQVLNDSADNLVQKLEMIADIETPNLTLKVSDRAKFVGDVYYEPRVVFPNISRTVGDWLAGVLEFSSLDISVNNTDKKFEDILPGGVDYDGFIGSTVTVKVGLRELSSTYTTIFSGKITDVGGFGRDTSSFNLTVRSDMEKVNVTIPFQIFLASDFPNIEDNFINLSAPIIYGDWTTNHRAEAPAIPAFPVNGLDPLVNSDLGNPGAGNTPLRCVISGTPIKTLVVTTITLKRGDDYFTFSSSDISIIGGTQNTTFDITQKNLSVNGSPWIYAPGDEIFVECVGVNLGAYDDNIVWQARDMLTRFGGVVGAELDNSWNTYRDKSTPAQSNIAGIKARVWIQEPVALFEYVLSMLEQVRLEAFVDRNNKFKLVSLHFEDFVASPNLSVRNWDTRQASLNPSVDDRNNFNRAKADFDFDPSKGENRLGTPLFRNDAAVTQAGRAISKLITYNNLYIESDVINQLTEVLRLASGFTELVDVVLTPRMFLVDVGDFVKFNTDIGSIRYEDIPCMIRSIGYDPNGSIPAKVWSYQLINFPGYTAPSGSVGGYNVTITQET